MCICVRYFDRKSHRVRKKLANCSKNRRSFSRTAAGRAHIINERGALRSRAHIFSLSLPRQGESTRRLGGISLLSGSRDTSGESALGISARLARAAGGGPTDLNETESENFSAYQGCPNAATRINTHGDRRPPLTFKRTQPPGPTVAAR